MAGTGCDILFAGDPFPPRGTRGMKIVLVRPNYKSHIITPPLGLGYLASYLRQNGMETRIIDGLRNNLSPDETMRMIAAENPDAVGITCLTAFYGETVRLARMVKERNIRCIIGGVHPTFLPYGTLVDSRADYVICGEGEVALSKLARNGFVNDGIPGVYSLDNLPGEDAPVRKGEIIEDLDDIPFPDWDQMDPNAYPKAPHGAIVNGFPIGVVTSSRGCPYQCTFCASPAFYGRRIRFRSPENVVAEIRHLVDRFGVREIHFEDDNLTMNRGHVERICRLILDGGIKVSWACPNGIRADKVDEDLIALMKESGCYYFAYGIESADDGILKNIRKMETIETIGKSIGIAARHGISCQGFFILGLPGETRETIEKTISFAKRSKLARAQFLILDVIPGSELWDVLRGRFVPDWGKNSYKEPEWIPEGLTKSDLMKAQAAAFRRFYLRPGVFLGLARSIKPQQVKYLFQRLFDFRIIRKPGA